MELDQIKIFLFNHIKRSIQTDIRPLLKNGCAGEVIGGYFAVPVLVFTLIEYLGRLRYGYIKEGVSRRNKWSGSNCAIWWIKRYMGASNKRYRKLGGLIYDMFRHGTVHSRQPKQYLFNLYKGFGWEIRKGDRQEWNLGVRLGRWFELSLDQLVSNLETGVDLFWADLESSSIIRSKFSNAYRTMKKPQWIPYITGKKGRKKYLHSDLIFISREVKSWKNKP